MPKTLHSFVEFRVWTAKLRIAARNDANEMVRATYNDVLFELIQRTPVDVGTARSNWTISLNGFNHSKLRAYSPFKSRWRPLASSYYAAGGTRAEQQNLRPAVAAVAAIARQRKDDQTVYINNNLPYIERLNEGYSRQSGPGLILAGFDAGVQQARGRFTFANIDRLMR